MADLKVEVTRVLNVDPHDNADRLEIATVFGYKTIIGKGQFKTGDFAVYFPVDSILPQSLEDHIFEGSKMKLTKNRVKAARIRGAMSQGLLVSLPKIKAYYIGLEKREKVSKIFWKVGTDLTEELGVTKHDPEKNKPAALRGQQVKKSQGNPFFRKYTKIQHIQKNLGAFEPGQDVFITEKIHGTNFRAGWVPTVGRTWIDRLRIKLSKSKWALVRALSLDEWTFVYGSHNVQLKSKSDTGYYSGAKTNVYEQCVIANDLRIKIPLGEVWYGEIYGPGIQKGYGYDMGKGETDVRFFDIQDSVSGRYNNFMDVVDEIVTSGLKVVPYWMEYFDKTWIDTCLNTPAMISKLDEDTDVEGIVIRPYNETEWLGGRAILKWISDAYLLKKGMTEYK